MLPHFCSTGKDNGPMEWPWLPDSWPRIRGVAFWLWDIPGCKVFYSREWQSMLQSDEEGILGPSNAIWWPMVHADDLEPFMEAAREIAEKRTDQYRTLFRIQRADGAWIWMLSVGCVTEWSGDEPTMVSGTITDVSQLRNDVKFQHGSHTPELESSLLANSPDLIVRMDKKLSPLFNNPGVARYLTRSAGMGPLAENGRACSVPPELLRFLEKNVARVFDSGLSVREVVTFPTSYGHDVTGEYSFWPEYGEKGQVLSVLTQFRDLTEQILAQRRARLNEMRLEALYHLTQMDNAPREQVLEFVMESLIRLTVSEAGFLFFPVGNNGEEGNLVWSSELRGRVGRASLPRAALPEDILDLLSGGDKVIRRRLANGNGLFPLLRALDGALDIMKFISAPMFDRDRLVCIAAVFNKDSLYYEDDLQQLEAFVSSSWHILRQHSFVQQLQKAKEMAELANAELQRAKESAESANKVKDSFLANVSHELRTPLNGMLSMLQLLEEMHLSPLQREFVGTASVSGRSLLRILSDILDFSRMEADKFELRDEAMDLAETIRSAVKLFQQEAQRKGLDFTLVIDDNLPPFVRGDDARIRQIIFNLVGNALKFTDRGSISVYCRALTARDLGPGFAPDAGQAPVRFSVKDTGIGIAPELRHTIFEPFTQLDNSPSKQYAGTGLGLTIVRRIVSLMGGTVEVASQPGVGTTMQCDLPFVRAMEGPARREKAQDGEAPDALPVMDILVAEDDPTSRLALSLFLQRAGHRTFCVGSGGQALEALQLHTFHCLFTDIQMPGMDGLELVGRMRRQEFGDFPPTEDTRQLLRITFPEEPDAAFSGTEPDATASRTDPDIPAVSVSAHAMTGDKDRFLRQGMDYYISKPILLKDLEAVLTLIAKRLMARGKL